MPVTCYPSTITLIDPEGNILSREFFYNESNQLSKVEDGGPTDKVYIYAITGKLEEEEWNATGYCKLASKKFTYFNSKIVEAFRKATGPGTCANADGLYGHTATYYLDNEKLLIKVMLKYQNFQKDSTIYLYTKGNITTEKTYIKPSTEDTYVLGQLIEYEYDSKPNPWHIYKQLLTVESLSKNNIIKMSTLTRQSYSVPYYTEWTQLYTYTYTPEGYPETRSGGYYSEKFEYFCEN